MTKNMKIKYVVTEGIVVVGTYTNRISANKACNNSMDYYRACGFKMTGNVKTGYEIIRYVRDDNADKMVREDMPIKVWTIKDFLDNADRELLDKLLCELNQEYEVYYEYESSYGHFYTHTPTTAEIVKYLAFYIANKRKPHKSTWRNNDWH